MKDIDFTRRYFADIGVGVDASYKDVQSGIAPAFFVDIAGCRDSDKARKAFVDCGGNAGVSSAVGRARGVNRQVGTVYAGDVFLRGAEVKDYHVILRCGAA